jgi:type III secretion protein Q
MFVYSNFTQKRECWLSRRRIPQTVQTNAGTFSILPAAPVHELQRASRWLVGGGFFGDSSVEWALPRSTAELIVTRAIPEIESDELSAEMLSLCVDAALLHLREALESASSLLLKGNCLEERDASHLTSGAVRITFGDNVSVPILLSLDLLAAARFDEWVASFDEDETLSSAIPHEVSFRLGYCSVSRSELMALRPGDGLLLDNLTDDQKVVAVVANRLAQLCSRNDRQQWCLHGALNIPLTPQLMNFTDFPEQYAMDKTSPDDAVSLASLPVHLVFEIGRVDMKIDEISAVGVGHVFELHRQIQASVDILAGGKKIGVGEVVQVGEVLGVRVVWISR